MKSIYRQAQGKPRGRPPNLLHIYQKPAYIDPANVKCHIAGFFYAKNVVGLYFFPKKAEVSVGLCLDRMGYFCFFIGLTGNVPGKKHGLFSFVIWLARPPPLSFLLEI